MSKGRYDETFAGEDEADPDQTVHKLPLLYLYFDYSYNTMKVLVNFDLRLIKGQTSGWCSMRYENLDEITFISYLFYVQRQKHKQ